MSMAVPAAIIRNFISVSSEVDEALRSKRPVVALESTIISHGMPYPDNLHTALKLESIVRANYGALPATIAIINGIPRVGLSEIELELLAKPGSQVRKVARRDIAACMASRAHGATTVSATMHLAAAIDIRVLATGGIGGVHRGVNDTYDVSADITALAQIPMIVVCAGIKTVLDVPKTIEALETASVPVVTLNPVKGDFPGFYIQRSGVKTPDSVADEASAAQLFSIHRRVSSTGMLIAVPISDAHTADTSLISNATSQAVREAKDQGISGSAITPFLLSRVAELTRNRSLQANIQLVMQNAAVAARIAGLMTNIEKETDGRVVSECCSVSDDPVAPCKSRGQSVDVVVAGGIALDLLCSPESYSPLVRETSNPGTIRQSLGGVGCNIARSICMNDINVGFYSAIGDDIAGQVVHRLLTDSGVDSANIGVITGTSTAIYCAINSHDGDLHTAVASMGIFNETLPALNGPKEQMAIENKIMSAKIVCVDGNLNVPDLRTLVRMSAKYKVPVWFEPTSVAKSPKIIACGDPIFSLLTYISPNIDELYAIWSAIAKSSGAEESIAGLDEAARLDVIAREILRIHRGAQFYILCTMGAHGLRVYRKIGDALDTMYIPAGAVPEGRVVSSSGAGDVLVGTMIAQLVRSGFSPESVEHAAYLGVKAASESCAKHDTVPIRMARL